ncbi:MAG: glutamate-cysteine ligase family protein, partial [Gemmatimonadales bacterium]
DGSARATLPVLRRVAAHAGWTERPSPYGAPIFVTPSEGVVSYEPGGQIEYSAAAATAVGPLVADLRAVVETLSTAAANDGIDFLTVGIDPRNGIDDVPLQLHGPQYTAMDRYFGTLGPAGQRMMRQTAACQVTLDAGDDPLARWHLLSAVAPYITALFANSPRYAGAQTGMVSARADTWATLDPLRTGLPGATAADPAAAYARFALRAPWIFRPATDGTYRSFAAVLARGDAQETDWDAHLTTLFPEIRPRRIAGVPTFEVRSADAMPVAACAALCVVLIGLTRDREAGAEAMALAEPASPTLLARAGRLGLRDPEIRRVAPALYRLALAGAARLGNAIVAGEVLERAQEFGRRYALAERSPADDDLPDPMGPGTRAPVARPDARHVPLPG